MKTTGVVMLGALALVFAAAVPAPAQKPRPLNASQVGQTQALQGGVQGAIGGSVAQPRPLFMIGKDVAVYLWAPVAPHYDSHANRNLAADPLWEATGGTSQPSAW